jgi:ribosome recycling factor
MEEYLDALADDMKSALEALSRDLGKVRTGRASPKLVDGVAVIVQSYGATMPLNQLGNIQAPDPRLITVTPWDKSTIADIEKAIIASGLGLNPSNDGQFVRVPVPPLSQQRRVELQKLVRKAGEDSKVRIRGVRREYNETFKNGERDGECTEDQCRRLLEKVQQATDKAIEQVEKLVVAKEAEVMEV